MVARSSSSPQVRRIRCAGLRADRGQGGFHGLLGEVDNGVRALLVVAAADVAATDVDRVGEVVSVFDLATCFVGEADRLLAEDEHRPGRTALDL